MKKFVIITIALTFLGLSTDAFAQDEPETQFITIDELAISGDRVMPDVEWSSAEARARFEKMSELKKSFLPRVQASTDAL